jgi:hypothetical protein
MAQAECITTAIRELMSRGRPPKSTSPVRAAHAELVAALAGNPPRPIRLEVDSLDLDDRAEHVAKLLAAVHVYLTAILADTAANIPGGGLDHKYLDGLYSDFAGDAVGGIQQAAAEMREHETWRAS